MATRYGDANENGDPGSSFNQTRRRLTQHYGPTTAHHTYTFKAFTRESLANIQKRKTSRIRKRSSAFLDPVKPKPEPDPYLASGQQLPPALVRQLPAELIGKPIEDIDPYYEDQEVNNGDKTHCHN